MEDVKRIFIEPVLEFVKEFIKKFPALLFIIIGILIPLFDIPWSDIKIHVKYIVASIPIIIGSIWLMWTFYANRFLQYTQDKYFNIIWNWHWKRELRGEGTWTVSLVAPQCPVDKTRLDGTAREGGKQFWSCDKCGKEYSNDMTLEEEINKLKNLVVGKASRFYGFRMGEAQETGKLKK